MKKKVIFALMPLFLIMVAVGGFLFWTSKRTTVIEVDNWNEQGEKFFLCDIKVSNCSKWQDYVFFVPEEEDAFLNEITKHTGYLGMRNFPHLGIADNPSYYFYFNNGIFAVEQWNAGYQLNPCMTIYSGIDYKYPSPGSWDPLNSPRSEMGELTFDEFFGTYEDALWFYGRFDEDTVICDPERQTITVSVYDNRKDEMCADRRIVIDFLEKTVEEVVEGDEKN